MKLYIIKCYNKAGYPIGDHYVVASNERNAKAALKADEMCAGWVGKMKVINVEWVVIAD